MTPMVEARPPIQSRLRLPIALLVVAAALFSIAIAGLDFSLQTASFNAPPAWLHAVGALMIGAAVVLARDVLPAPAWLRRSLAASLILALMQVFLVGARFSAGVSSWAAAAYVAAALLIQSVVLATVTSVARAGAPGEVRLRYETSFSRLVLWLLGFGMLSLVSGAFVSVSAKAACQTWPLCGDALLPQTAVEWIHLLHRASVGIGGLLAIRMFYTGWQAQRHQPRTLVLITAVTILFAAQGIIGAMIATGRPGQTLAGLHAVSGAAVWALMVLLVLEVGLAGPGPSAEQPDVTENHGWRSRLGAFTMLTKPVIVLLLLATTLGGMIVGARAWPAFPTVIWTLLGGALAAGGSGAINQFIDRDVDARMKRTARRPLVAGRLTPAEALAFGVGLCLLAFYLLALFVNLLAALLSVAGMLYYVWLYSLVLKKMTVQNIVIGGGAGAIPPLVGWAAATGGLTWQAALLFVIIFIWTPPHFWALALIRSKDYARGGIPMLPVVRGERETRRQILIYTLVLVATTLLAGPAGLAGWFYTLGAVALGIWLAGIAYRLWRQYTPKLAWKMYRQSSMYLLYLFVLLAADALLR